MILDAFRAALGQLGDRRFLKVVGIGLALTLALLLGSYAAFMLLIDWLTPEALTLPWVGEVHWIKDLLGSGSFLLMMGLSIFLMVPVAALFSSLFLEDIAAAVEDRHYPGLPPATPQGLYDGMISAVNFFGVLLAANLLALLLYPFAGPFAPLLFWAVNGYLLGRDYFMTVACRHMARASAQALHKAWRGRIWLAGVLMAAPLSLPLVNLLIPILGVATFTHLFHRIRAAEVARRST